MNQFVAFLDMLYEMKEKETSPKANKLNNFLFAFFLFSLTWQILHGLFSLQ